MKQLMMLYLAAQFFTSCHSQSSVPATMPSDKIAADNDKQPGFAVLELFTSQGCSSCPAADALLGKEIAAYSRTDKKLIALSFHVDYWNRLGWSDPYSQHIFTERQYGYSAKMKGNGVYTPQVVINGQWETVGSKQATVENFIKQGLSENTEAAITIDAIKQKGENLLEISYQYKGSVADLNVAVVQNTISTSVKAGENDGRTLTSYNVVRSWKMTEAQNGSHLVEVEVPAGYNSKEYSVVIYVQEKGFGKIVAADKK